MAQIDAAIALPMGKDIASLVANAGCNSLGIETGQQTVKCPLLAACALKRTVSIRPAEVLPLRRIW